MAVFQRYAEGRITEIDSRATYFHTPRTGDGAAAHAEAHRHWARGEAMMRQALVQLQKAATSAHGHYTGAVSTNLRMWWS
ncbi:secretion protein [Mycobacterium sp. E2479]|uniref:secretion protein n=1 Tax=Mycobacterium sp. E2479 TaxID=1834134 RepID=UPI0007FFCABD|nr:secretion protein [Mycobacterium sp. E2479]OBH52155.1 secretion protein [Mycobacterium sp. E2479]